MIVSLAPFEPWRLWPWEKYTTQKDDGLRWYEWTRYHWLFVVVDVRGKLIYEPPKATQ